MDLDSLANNVNQAMELRHRPSRHASVDDDVEGAGREVRTESRPQSAKSLGESYVGSAHSICLVAVNGQPETKFWKCKSGGLWGCIKTVLSLTLFVILNFCAFTTYFFDVKLLLVRLLHYQSLSSFIDFGYNAMELIEALFYLCLFLFRDSLFCQLLGHVRGLKDSQDKGQLSSPRMVKIITFCLITSSIASAILHSADCGGGTAGILSWDVNKWLLETHAYFFALALFVWTPSGYGKSDELKPLYSARTTKNILLGIFDAFFRFCANLQTFVILDIVLSNTITYFIEARSVSKICEPISKNIDEATNQLRGILRLKEHRKRFNAAFGTLIRAMISEHLFMFTYLLGEVLEKETYALINLVYFLCAMKAILFYVISCKINDYGQESLLCAKTLNESYATLNVDGEEISLSVLVHQLEAYPIAVGRDGFLINEPFCLALLGGVFGFFGMLASARKLV